MITRQVAAGCKVVAQSRDGKEEEDPPFLTQYSAGRAPHRTLIYDPNSGSLRFTKPSGRQFRAASSTSTLSSSSQLISGRFPGAAAFVGRGSCTSSLASAAHLAAPSSINNKTGSQVDGYSSDGTSRASSPTCVIRNSSLRSISSSTTLSSLSKASSSEMDKGDYSEVKELITTNSNCATSRFDGDSAVFYGASTKDEMAQKGAGDPRSFRKLGADIASRQGIKGGYNSMRSEKDPSSWAIVHDMGHHALHFSDVAADIAFVTKNALALRDAQSKESQTAPFKSIQSPSIEKPSAPDDSKKNQNGTISASTGATRAATQTAAGGVVANHGPTNNNIFSFNSSRVLKAAATEADPYDYDSNFEKDSIASFDFNRSGAHRPATTVVGPLAKPTPSKWDDAEKWLSAGDAPAKPGPKTSPQLPTQPVVATAQPGARKAAGVSNNQDAADGAGAPNPTTPMVNPCADASSSSGDNSADTSPEKCNRFVDRAKKGMPRFAFLMPAGKPLPLPAAPVDRYPLEDVYGRDAGDAKESSMYSEAAAVVDDDGFPRPAALRTAKPTSETALENDDNPSRGAVEPGDPTPPTPPAAGPATVVVNMRTVCMRDMGTEMTPIASVEPSRTATPLRATTPTLGSPATSRPSTPGRTANALNPTPASSSERNRGSKPAGGNAEAERSQALSRKELQVKTRQEILALGTQLGKANIAAWATKEEEEADAAQALKASLELEEVRRNLLAARAAAWEEAEQAKYTARYKREEAKIQAWENHEKAKAEAEMRRIEVKVERMRSHANEKLMNKLAAARRRAEDLRAKAEALRGEQASKTAGRADQIRRTGKIPTSFLGHLCE